MPPTLGIIEGFYGKPWTWQERTGTVRFLAPYGYGFYLFAPKADRFLRRDWQALHCENERDSLEAFTAQCHDLGVRPAVGLSPYELHLNFDDSARNALTHKLNDLQAMGFQDLAILFDDMRGDLPDLADRQIEIVQWVQRHFSFDRLMVCPTYYADDPVLDTVFGQRPQGYLETLGAGLDTAIEIFWAGEEVCSRAFSPGHLKRVGRQIGRKPLLWDNYPVNDGARMSQYLHLRSFTGRPAEIAEHIAGHGINPALQPVLSRIPAITLADSYRLGADYSYHAAFRAAAVSVLGEQLGIQVVADLLALQDTGLDRLGDKWSLLRTRYATFDHPGAREIVSWLDGGYQITNDEVLTQ